MNGLLHRLAARAAGTAALVRSDARLPYGREVPLSANLPEPRGAASSDAMAPASPVVPPPRGGASQPGDIGQAQVRPSAAEQNSAGGLSDEMLLPGSVQLAVADATHGAEPKTAARGERPPLGPVGATSVADAALIPATPSEPATTHHQGPRTAALQSRAVGAPSIGPVSTGPAPLLPPVFDPPAPGSALAPAGRLAASWQPAPSPQPGAGGAAGASEVHIHIGRVDVTAVREAPAPRRRQVSSPAPMALDTYLARRTRS